MQRKTLFNIHFYLSSFFTPFLFLMAITGTFYLFGNKGSVESVLISQNIQIQGGIDKKIQLEKYIKDIDPTYAFEYVKESGGNLITRPTTRDYFTFKKQGDGSYSVYKDSPNFLLRIIEVHKGHGPGILKWLQKILGVSLFLIVLSGLLMSLQMKARVKEFLVTSVVGGLILSMLFFL